ncbi:putative bifunctional diguanylate cyclase/phosphodiesterase [Paraburkholderia tropica]|uniref:putative bifunctional diguanylate cyclase/phosphodiesterase n=1 Tax=Paraburkholderia tropica TaxID=92647 RepID=UPI002AB2F984|nr:EAL domain-containing protein [Paraburkholderia tropica]
MKPASRAPQARDAWPLRSASAALRRSIRTRTKLHIGIFIVLFTAQTLLLTSQLLAVNHALEHAEPTEPEPAAHAFQDRYADRNGDELGERNERPAHALDNVQAVPARLVLIDRQGLRETDLRNLHDDSLQTAGDERALGVHDAARHARQLVKRTLEAALAIACLTLLLGVALFRHVERTMLQPLLTITDSLVRLARGEEIHTLPDLERTDEIGAMAKAFDALCARSRELKDAHEATRAAEAHAQALARHDPLTGLPNRRLLAAEMGAAFEQARRRGSGYLVIVIDLDRFKPVNDLYGHAAGDAVLCEIAARLRRNVRERDTVARLGGDEFAVLALAPHDEQADVARELAQRLLAAVRAPIDVDGVRLNVDASIGIACCPRDGEDADDLLRAADIAMYRAKCEGKGTYRFFEQKMDDELREQATLESDVRRALAGGEIRPYYQPLVRLADGQTAGFEILARWHHAERGWVPPDLFVPLIEQMGIAPVFMAAILRRASRDALRWPERYRLAFNISPAQFKDEQLVSLLLPILADEGFPPERLEIEITESALMCDFDIARAVLAQFRGAGLSMSLDDFGTGYSSLQHLHELHFDKLKIDRSFVLSMATCSESAKIVDAIVALASNLGMATVAEGVETQELARMLRLKGCEYAQGYYFGKAMAARDIDALLNVDRANALAQDAA